MSGWLLDTNVIAELTRPHGAVRVREWASAHDDGEMFISVLTIGEYEKGLHHLSPDHKLRPRIAASIAALETRFSGRLLMLTNSIVRRWGEVSGATKRLTGQSPPVIDTLLAATAIEHDLCLVTRNLRDVRHSGARIFNPWDGDPGTPPRR